MFSSVYVFVQTASSYKPMSKSSLTMHVD